MIAKMRRHHQQHCNICRHINKIILTVLAAMSAAARAHRTPHGNKHAWKKRQRVRSNSDSDSDDARASVVASHNDDIGSVSTHPLSRSILASPAVPLASEQDISSSLLFQLGNMHIARRRDKHVKGVMPRRQAFVSARKQYVLDSDGSVRPAATPLPTVATTHTHTPLAAPAPLPSTPATVVPSASTDNVLLRDADVPIAAVRPVRGAVSQRVVHASDDSAMCSHSGIRLGPALPPHELLDLPCLRSQFHETAAHRLRDTVRMPTAGRVAMIHAARKALRRYGPWTQTATAGQSGQELPLDTPTSPSWRTYTLQDVFKHGMFAWRRLGGGSYGVVVGACIRQALQKPQAGEADMSSTHAADDDEASAGKKQVWDMVAGIGTPIVGRSAQGAGAAAGTDPRTPRATDGTCHHETVSSPPPYAVEAAWAAGPRYGASRPGPDPRATTLLTVTGQRRWCAGVDRAKLWALPATREAPQAGTSPALGAAPMLAAVKLATVTPSVLRLLKARGNVVSTSAPPAELGLPTDSRTLQFIQADDGSLREALAGYYMNALIESRTTPHVTGQYGAVLVTQTKEADVLALEASGVLSHTATALGNVDPRTTTLCVATVTELSDMNLSAFIAAVKACALPDLRVRQLMCTILLQCLQALTALHTSCNLRHNDLHLQNVMVSFVSMDTKYTYRIPASSDFPYNGVVTVPTHGVSIRIIDWGMATGDVFGRDDTPRAWANSMHSPISLAKRYKDLYRIPNLACLDFAFLCLTLLYDAGKGTEMRAVIDEALQFLLVGPYDSDLDPDNILLRSVRAVPVARGVPPHVRAPLHSDAGKQTDELINLFRTLATQWRMPCSFNSDEAARGAFPAAPDGTEEFVTATSLARLQERLQATADPLYTALAKQATEY